MTATEKFSWLHVSDFHFRGGDPYDRNVVLDSLVRAVAENKAQGREPDLIFATGDIAHSGKASEYEHATSFFDALVAAAGLERRNLFIVPGNHDADRDQGIGLARTLSTGDEADKYFRPSIPKPHITLKLGAFRDWYNEYFKSIRELPDNSTCGPVEVTEVRGLRIGILPLNTALFSQDENDHNKLMIGRRCLQSATDELGRLKPALRIALMHHPVEWLHEVERANIKASLHATVHVILRGHLHENDIESVDSAPGGALHIAAGAAYQSRKYPNRALYSTFDQGRLEVFPIRYEDNPTEIWTVDPSVFPREPNFAKVFPIPRFENADEPPPAEVKVRPPTPAEVPRFRSNIPSRGDLPFVERDQILNDIEAALGDLSKERVLVLHGPPGVGKSELAREFARRQRARYPGGTFLVRTGNTGAELVDLADIGANVLGLHFSADLSLQDQCERTLLSLAVAPVLVIYDNVVNLDSISPLLPRSGMPFHVLITTLNERLSPAWPAIAVPPFSAKASLELITLIAGREVADRHGKTLVKLSGGLPIQLVPASIMLAYEARRGRLERTVLRITSEAERNFQLVYETLDSSVRLLLHAAAFLNCERIVRKELSPHLEQGCSWNGVEFDRQLDACLDFHLLEGAEELRMHQLFESFLRGVRIGDDLKAKLESIRAVQRNRFVELARSVAEKPADRELISALLTYSLEPHVWDQAEISLSLEDIESVGDGLTQIGKFEEARQWHERGIAETERSAVDTEVDHEHLGTRLHQVGYCLASVGKFAEAQLWFERAVAEKEKVDKDHANPDSLGISMHQVGVSLSSVGEFKEAQSWYERAVAEKEKGDVQGAVNHMNVGMSLHQVGVCLSSVNEFEQARHWYERAVAEKEKGDLQGRVDQDNLARSLHQVGVCLSSVDNFEEARQWFERAVTAAEQGDLHGRIDHDNLGKTLYQVGFCLSSVDKIEEAKPWFERAVAAAEQGDVHGRVNHANLGMNLHQIGFCLSALNKFEEAQPWFERAFTAMEKGDVHGRIDHESLGRSAHQVGFCLSNLNKLEEAMTWYERAVAEKEQGNVLGQVIGESVVLSLRNGADCLREMGQETDAQKWEDRADKYPLDGPKSLLA